jgi:subfamily B ATP-binding cassette protein MsbA
MITKRILKYFKPYLLQLISAFIILFFVAFLWEINTLLPKMIFDGPLKASYGIEKQAKERAKENNTLNLKKDKLHFIEKYKEKFKNFLIKSKIIKHTDSQDILSSKEDIKVIVIIILLLYLIKGFFTFAGYYLLGITGHKIIRDLRNDLYSSIINQNVAFFSKYHSGTLISRVTNDVYIVQNAITTKIGDLLKESLFLIFIVAAIFYIDYKMSIMLIIVIPMIIVPVILISKAIRKSTRKAQLRIGELTNVLKETITGSRIVKAFSMEKFEISKFKEVNMNFFRANRRLTVATVLSSPLMEMVGGISFCIILIYGSMKIQSGEMTTGTFMTYIMNVILLYSPIRRLNRVNNELQQAGAALGRIFEMMDVENPVVSPKNPEPFPNEIKSIEFKNVSFSYDKNEPLLQNINIKVNTGEIAAFVGSSGAGKTTLVNLIPRFYDVTKGAVLINKTDIRNFSLYDLRSHTGVVTQETILFDDTVINNIAYGRADIPFEQVKEAAKMAFAHEFIEQLPEKYNTMIGESGVRLSGGQKQRLSIARALLKNPPILILDEATSALDTESEILVQKALNNLMQDRTTFVIAHRLSTIRSADTIYVMDKGTVVEQGNHEELLKKGGIYTKLYKMQFGEHNG